MRTGTSIERRNGLAVFGVILVIAGVGWFVVRELRLDPFAAIADAGWPFFVIIPGVILNDRSTPASGRGGIRT